MENLILLLGWVGILCFTIGLLLATHGIGQAINRKLVKLGL